MNFLNWVKRKKRTGKFGRDRVQFRETLAKYSRIFSYNRKPFIVCDFVARLIYSKVHIIYGKPTAILLSEGAGKCVDYIVF